ncbi:hypothetical protein V8E53_012555 [Lactarius tabidus]
MIELRRMHDTLARFAMVDKHGKVFRTIRYQASAIADNIVDVSMNFGGRRKRYPTDLSWWRLDSPSYRRGCTDDFPDLVMRSGVVIGLSRCHPEVQANGNENTMRSSENEEQGWRWGDNSNILTGSGSAMRSLTSPTGVRPQESNIRVWGEQCEHVSPSAILRDTITKTSQEALKNVRNAGQPLMWYSSDWWDRVTVQVYKMFSYQVAVLHRGPEYIKMGTATVRAGEVCTQTEPTQLMRAKAETVSIHLYTDRANWGVAKHEVVEWSVEASCLCRGEENLYYYYRDGVGFVLDSRNQSLPTHVWHQLASETRPSRSEEAPTVFAGPGRATHAYDFLNQNQVTVGTLNRNHHGGKVFPRKSVGKDGHTRTQTSYRKPERKQNIHNPTKLKLRHQTIAITQDKRKTRMHTHPHSATQIPTQAK